MLEKLAKLEDEKKALEIQRIVLDAQMRVLQAKSEGLKAENKALAERNALAEIVASEGCPIEYFADPLKQGIDWEWCDQVRFENLRHEEGCDEASQDEKRCQKTPYQCWLIYSEKSASGKMTTKRRQYVQRRKFSCGRFSI
jgi:hypothetical protein